MAGDSQITGFNADEVRAGLRLAMQVGLPVEESDRPTFYMPVGWSTDGAHNVSEDGVPFDPDYRPARTSRRSVQVPAAVEYTDGDGKVEGFGILVPSKVVLTLLDEDYEQIKGFEFVQIAGQRFFYSRTESALALIEVGVWRIHCRSDDEG